MAINVKNFDSMPVYLYKGIGVHPECAKALEEMLVTSGVAKERIVLIETAEALHKLVSPLPSFPFSPRDLITAQRLPAALVFPGGQSLRMHAGLELESLEGRDLPVSDKRWNQDALKAKIEKLVVENGWSVFGICAGANLLCRNVVCSDPNQRVKSFHKFSGLNLVSAEVYADGFFTSSKDGKTNFQGGNNQRMVDCVIQTPKVPCGKISMYWNEGGVFSLDEKKDPPIPIVFYERHGENAQHLKEMKDLCGGFYEKRGQGRICALSVHPEFGNPIDSSEDDAIKQLRNEFFRDCLEYLNIINQRAERASETVEVRDLSWLEREIEEAAAFVEGSLSA